MAAKGQPKSGGRVKGTLNRQTQDLHAKCEARGIDPFDLLLEFCGEAPMELRFAAIKEICSYMYPKRKAIEHSGGISNPYLEMTLEELEAKVKENFEK